MAFYTICPYQFQSALQLILGIISHQKISFTDNTKGNLVRNKCWLSASAVTENASKQSHRCLFWERLRWKDWECEIMEGDCFLFLAWKKGSLLRQSNKRWKERVLTLLHPLSRVSRLIAQPLSFDGSPRQQVRILTRRPCS